MGRGEDGPRTPCSRASACAGADMTGPAGAGGGGRGRPPPAASKPPPLMGALVPASRFISAARALEFRRMPPPSSAPTCIAELEQMRKGSA